MLRTVSNAANIASVTALAAATVASEHGMRLGYRLRLVNYIVDVIFDTED